jgi:hypothetical protein
VVDGWRGVKPNAAMRTSTAPVELALFDHLVRPLQERPGNGETERLCRLQIDDELKRRRLLDRKITRFRAAQDLVYVVPGPPEQVF